MNQSPYSPPDPNAVPNPAPVPEPPSAQSAAPPVKTPATPRLPIGNAAPRTVPVAPPAAPPIAPPQPAMQAQTPLQPPAQAMPQIAPRPMAQVPPRPVVAPQPMRAMPYPPPSHLTSKVPGKGLATASLVLGIVGVAGVLFPLLLWVGGIITGILGIIFAAMAKKHGFVGGTVTAGLVLSIISVALNGIIVFAFVSSFIHYGEFYPIFDFDIAPPIVFS